MSTLIFPDEVDVFRVPHSRMKQLVNNCFTQMEDTNFVSSRALQALLDSLRAAFIEFMSHERIENKLIVRQLSDKMRQRSVFNQVLCDCHKDNRLTEMLSLFSDGFKTCTAEDRINYGTKLEKELREFINGFLPHMKEEEEVFQPLLIQYFTYEELCSLKLKVIQQHTRTSTKVDPSVPSVYGVPSSPAAPTLSKDSEKHLSHKVTKQPEVEECVILDGSQVPINSLPPELLQVIFQFLDVQALSRCAQVCTSWAVVARDPSLWTSVLPTQWARGDWSFNEVHADNIHLVTNRDNDDAVANYDDKVTDVVLSFEMFLLPKVCHRITKLVLSYSGAVTDDMVCSFLLMCPNIRHLDLSMTDITDTGFISWHNVRRSNEEWMNESHVEHINLSGCHRITDMSLRMLSCAVSHLRYADFSGCLRVTSAGLWQLALAAPFLEPSLLYYCDNIEDGPFPDQANGCSNIECDERRICCRLSR